MIVKRFFKRNKRSLSSSLSFHPSILPTFHFILLVLFLMVPMVDARAESDGPPGDDKVLEAHRELMERYGFLEKGKREINEDQVRRYSYRENEVEEREEESGRDSISFFEWLRGLSLPVVLIIVVVLIILFYLMVRGVPGFFQKGVDVPGQQSAVGYENGNRDEEMQTGDKGYNQALELAKQGEYGKALILLHKASVKKLRENHWIPPGKNYTNNDIRWLIKGSSPGKKLFTPFSELATAAERVAFKGENPGEDIYGEMRKMYEAAFLKMPARDRY